MMICLSSLTTCNSVFPFEHPWEHSSSCCCRCCHLLRTLDVQSFDWTSRMTFTYDLTYHPVHRPVDEPVMRRRLERRRGCERLHQPRRKKGGGQWAGGSVVVVVVGVGVVVREEERVVEGGRSEVQRRIAVGTRSGDPSNPSMIRIASIVIFFFRIGFQADGRD